MNEYKFRVFDKVRLLQRGENGGGFKEISRGAVLAVADGKHGQWIKFFDTDLWTNPEVSEWIHTNSNRSKVVKWL